ncbi:thiamine phosphate synthase [Salegentibacter sp. HM20]
MKYKIQKGGVYLVIDPSMEEKTLLSRMEKALHETIVAVQIWDNFMKDQDILALVEKVCKLCHSKKVPVLINNRWECLSKSSLDGIHFDEIPANIEAIRKQVNRAFYAGLTCNNNLEWVAWAQDHNLDYISFCSVFPSATSNSCELVEFDTIKKARESYSIPIFLAGGISPENIQNLANLEYEGIAVISGIMNAENPRKAVQNYLNKINQNRL